MKKVKAVVVMMAMFVMVAAMAGCGDGSSTATTEQQNNATSMYAAAKPTAVPGQFEVIAYLPTGPALQAFVWFCVERTDMPEPVLATITKEPVMVNYVNGEAHALIDGLNQGGDYIVKMSTMIPGTNPPITSTDFYGNPGRVMEQTLTFRAADMAALWP